MTIKNAIIGAGFAGFHASRLHRAASALARGRGLILTFHRVRSECPPTGYAPNGALQITPQFFELTLDVIRREGFELVSLGEARRRLVEAQGAPFAALTFDDGYRDTLIEALPVLERCRAPFTVYCATGFIERTARLWWLELEDAIGRLDTVDIGRARIPARTPAENRPHSTGSTGCCAAGPNRNFCRRSATSRSALASTARRSQTGSSWTGAT